MAKFKLNNKCSSDKNSVLYSDEEQLAMIMSIYGSEISEIEKDGKILAPAELVEIQEKFEWDYLSPSSAYSLVDVIKLPEEIQRKLSKSSSHLDKTLTHKRVEENVVLSDYEKFGKSVAFRAYANWHELNSDHESNHVDGIKLFEAIRQAMLASFHINNLQYDSAVALTNLKIDYLKYIENFTPFIIHAIPVNKPDGGPMFAEFGVYQEGQLVAKAYLGTYTFRSKSSFSRKRLKLIEGAYNVAKSENWPIIEEKVI